MQRLTDLWVSRLLAFIALALIVFVVWHPLAAELSYTADPLRAYRSMQQIGDQCVASFDRYPEGLNFQSLWNLPRDLKPILVPFRRDPNYVRPANDRYVYVRCDFSIPELPEIGRQRFISLGRLFGKAEVRLNGQLVWAQEKVEMPILAIPYETKGGAASLEIIAFAKEGSRGPASLLPLVLTANVDDIRSLSFWVSYRAASQGLPGVGIAFAFSMLFFICYWRGLRYRDVLWALVAFSSYGALVGLNFSLTGERTALGDLIVDHLSWVTHLATAATIYSFLRLPGSNLKIFLVVAGGCFVNYLRTLLPIEFRNMFGLYTRNDPYFFAVIFALLLAAVLREDKSKLPVRRLRQMRMLSAVLIFGIISWTVSGIIAMRTGVDFSGYVLFFILVAYGLFLSFDLVVYHRAYFTEKSLKEDEVRQRTALEERLELGERIQKMLMPGDFHPRFDPWEIDILYESAERMAGDWFTYTKKNDVVWAFCGDVVGKGPQAAIATSSLLTTLRNSTQHGSSINEVIRQTDQSLSGVFLSSMVSTIAGAELHANGTVRSMAHGFVGWIHLSARGGARVIPGRGSLLGTGEIGEINFHQHEMEPGDRLLIFSDGVADGSRASYKILKELESHHQTMSPAEIIDLVKEMGSVSALIDDKVMLVVSYQPGSKKN